MKRSNPPLSPAAERAGHAHGAGPGSAGPGFSRPAFPGTLAHLVAGHEFDKLDVDTCRKVGIALDPRPEAQHQRVAGFLHEHDTVRIPNGNRVKG